MNLFRMIIAGAILAFLNFVPPSALGQEARPTDAGLNHRAAGLRLSNIISRDMFVRAMWEAELPAGMVASWGCEPMPSHDFLPLLPSVREVLNRIVSVEPEYAWEVSDGVVNLVARGQEPLLFETKIAKFEVTDADSLNLVMGDLLAVPGVREQVRRELGAQLIQISKPYPYNLDGLARARRKFSVSLTDVTVREALNAIAHAGSAIWIFQRSNCPHADRKVFSLDFVDLYN